MTGRINLTPEAGRQLDDLDDWIAANATPDIARRFVSAVLDHIDGILLFPHAGRVRDDVRPAMRTTTYKKRTLVAYEIDESSGEIVVTVLGVFHGCQDWEAALSADEDSEEDCGSASVRDKDVAGESSEPVDDHRPQSRLRRSAA